MHKQSSAPPVGNWHRKSFLVEELFPAQDSETSRESVLGLGRVLGLVWSLARLQINTGCTTGSGRDMRSLAHNRWARTNPAPHTDPKHLRKAYLVSSWAQEQGRPGE